MDDDDKIEAPSHTPGTRKGEELAADDEPGREETGKSSTGRPSGTSSARDFTGVNPQDPIDPEMMGGRNKDD